MNLTIKGGTYRRRELTKSIISMLQKYMPTGKEHLINIDVQFIGSSDASASCAVKGSNYFLIKIGTNYTVKETIELLIHEYTHLKQTITDNCTTDCVGITYWRGKKYDKRYIDPGCVEYWRAPWEVEAFGAQTIIPRLIEYKLEINLDWYTWYNCNLLINTLKNFKVR